MEAPAAEAEPRLTCMLVEDNAEYALLVEQMLADELGSDVSVRAVDSVGAARELLRELAPDCVLVDLGLPDAEGLEAVDAIQAIAPAVPVIVLSGREDDAIAVNAVQEGVQDYLVKRDVTGPLLARSIRYAIERKLSELDVAHRAMHDQLTGLPNRSLFIDRLRLALARVERGERCLGVLFIDLDRFKAVNDNFGHETGDELLMKVSERIAGYLRASDTVARFGGDEFLLLCDDLRNPQEAVHLARRLIEDIERPFELQNHTVEIGASAGIAIGENGSDDLDALISAADTAMFLAKRRGSRLELASASTVGAGRRQLDVGAELTQAIENGEFRLEYQPQVDLRTQGLIGVEALIRWEHPQKGTVLPGEFIGGAERTGVIGRIGEWVIDEAMGQLAAWRADGKCRDDMVMSVNLSPLQIADARICEVIESALERHGVPAPASCFEITESTVAANPEASAEILGTLKQLGVAIAIDDFGTGHSSLGTLDAYPIDLIKIDRSFVAPLDGDLRHRRFFGAVLGVAHALGVRAIAEGIETREQLEVVARLGCDIGQGFFLGRPGVPEVAGGRLRMLVEQAKT